MISFLCLFGGLIDEVSCDLRLTRCRVHGFVCSPFRFDSGSYEIEAGSLLEVALGHSMVRIAFGVHSDLWLIYD